MWFAFYILRGVGRDGAEKREYFIDLRHFNDRNDFQSAFDMSVKG